VHVAVYLPLIVPVFAALAARPLADRLPPAAATWLLAASALALALASSAVLGMLALSALVRIPVIDALGHLSRPVINSGDAVSLPVAIVAGGLLVMAAVAACRAVWRRGRAIAAAHRHASGLPGAGQVVVTEDNAADAYTVPGWPCRIVITQGMLRALSAGERSVLLAHERSHAQGSHYLFTSVARLAAAANPLLRPVAAQAGYTVERWADERAATAAGDRPLAARAIAKAALAAAAAPPRRASQAGSLGAVAAHPAARGAGVVPRRVEALLRPPPRPRLLLAAAAVVLVAVSGLAALGAAVDLHLLVEMAQAAALR